MADAALVDVLDAGDQLLVHADGSLLVQPLMTHNVVEELTVLAELHDEEQLALCLDDLVQLDHVRVSHFLENLDFARDTLYILLVLDSALFEYLDGDLFVCKRVRRQLDLTEGTLAERFSHRVMAEASALRVRIICQVQV